MKIVTKSISSIVFVVILIIIIACISNSTIKTRIQYLAGENYINANEYPKVIIDTLTKINDNNIFSIGSARDKISVYSS